MGNLYHDYNANAKTISNLVAQTITFTGTDMPSSGVTAYHIYFTGGAANQVGNLTRIRVKANSQTIWDFNPSSHYRTFIERMSRSNVAIASGATRLTLPFYLLDAKGDDRYTSQFPKNAIPTIEVVTNASFITGTAVISWDRTDMKPSLFPKLLGITLNAGASLTNYTYPISTDGEVRGFSINTTGLNRAKLVLDDVVRWQADGTNILECDQMESPQTITDPLFKKLHGTQPAPPGRSYFNLDTAGGWAGVGNEAMLWTFHRQ
jgi:hypothetical protein